MVRRGIPAEAQLVERREKIIMPANQSQTWPSASLRLHSGRPARWGTSQ